MREQRWDETPTTDMPPTTTPWGELEYTEELSAGLYVVATAGHGGLYIAPGPLREALHDRFGPSPFLESIAWWEEDIDAIVALILLIDMLRDNFYAQNAVRNYTRLKSYRNYVDNSILSRCGKERHDQFVHWTKYNLPLTEPKEGETK
jgi:hypothetical protein